MFSNTKRKGLCFLYVETYLRNICIRMETKDLWAVHGREWLDVFKILVQGFAHWNFISSVKTEIAVKDLFIKPYLWKIQRKKPQLLCYSEFFKSHFYSWRIKVLVLATTSNFTWIHEEIIKSYVFYIWVPAKSL